MTCAPHVHTVRAAQVTDEAGVNAALDAAADHFGAQVSVACSCAGIGYARRVLNRSGVPHDQAGFEKVFRINTFGTFNVLRLAAAR
jgi:NAD(P)-dependent dehydrogenase (short-subunit alcohol dehydrogenase family)